MKDALIGRTIAERYRLLSRLGAGRTATVYLARHVVIEHLSAIKLVHPAFSHPPAHRDRFLREAQAVNRINHPNIVEISDYGESTGLVYLVMEYVPGEPLRRVLSRGALGWRRAAHIGLQIASALGRAHQAGVIHRNLDPGSILLVPESEERDLAKLTDFGVAKLVDAATMTREGFAPGTPGYIAPELIPLGEASPRSDLFSLGALLYEATAGTLPFDIGDRSPLFDQLAGFSLPPYPRADSLLRRAPDASPAFEDILMRMLAPDPADRPRDGFEVCEILRGLLRREQRAAKPRGEKRRRARRAEREENDDGPISSTIPPPPPDPLDDKTDLTLLDVAQIAPVLSAALGRLEARWAAQEGPLAEDDALAEARQLVSRVCGAAALIAADSSLIELHKTRSRALRAELGEQIDAVARERSRALGWAGSLAERTYHVEARRSSGEHPVHAVEVMVWEQAALQQEEDQVRAGAEALEVRRTTLNREIERQNEEIERDLAAANAALEGRIGALRVLGIEALAAIDVAAAPLGQPRNLD